MEIVKARLRLWLRDQRGQDLIEYAMLAGFLAVAVAAVFPTTIAPSICLLFSQVSSKLVVASS
jgi:pilus assembly protein Flp/PilA